MNPEREPAAAAIARHAIRPLRNYVRFGGRAPRAEFGCFIILVLAMLGLAHGIDRLALVPAARPDVLSIVATLALAPPALAVTARRLHDTGRSGWWQLLMLVPAIGWGMLLLWCLLPGRRGSNSYGPDPLRRYRRV